MKEKVTGTMVYYYFVCKRKLWYFSNEINMESENESVILGKLLDEGSFKRDEKHINIDDTINIKLNNGNIISKVMEVNNGK